MISLSSKGDFSKTEKMLKKTLGRDYMGVLERYGRMGVEALAASTPVKTGLTASSWSYEIVQKDSYLSVVWNNSNIQKGVSIALILQYGHGTRNGGYVRGRDYINPALQPVFDKMADAAWKEVTSA